MAVVISPQSKSGTPSPVVVLNPLTRPPLREIPPEGSLVKNVGFHLKGEGGATLVGPLKAPSWNFEAGLAYSFHHRRVKKLFGTLGVGFNFGRATQHPSASLHLPLGGLAWMGGTLSSGIGYDIGKKIPIFSPHLLAKVSLLNYYSQGFGFAGKVISDFGVGLGAELRLGFFNRSISASVSYQRTLNTLNLPFPLHQVLAGVAVDPLRLGLQIHCLRQPEARVCPGAKFAEKKSPAPKPEVVPVFSELESRSIMSAVGVQIDTRNLVNDLISSDEDDVVKGVRIHLGNAIQNIINNSILINGLNLASGISVVEASNVYVPNLSAKLSYDGSSYRLELEVKVRGRKFLMPKMIVCTDCTETQFKEKVAPEIRKYIEILKRDIDFYNKKMHVED